MSFWYDLLALDDVAERIVKIPGWLRHLTLRQVKEYAKDHQLREEQLVWLFRMCKRFFRRPTVAQMEYALEKQNWVVADPLLSMSCKKRSALGFFSRGGER